MSERVYISNAENIKLKRKMEEEQSISSMFTPSKSRRVLGDSDSSPKPVDPSNNQVQEENQHSCKFCNKKFSSCQALGGHQNAHKKERIFLNTFGFRPNNVHLYPYSSSPMANLLLQDKPCYHGAHIHPMVYNPNMSSTLAPPSYGINQRFFLTPHNFGTTTSWVGGATTSQWRLNTETMGLSQKIPLLAESASKGLAGGSSSGIGADFGRLTLQGSPSVSTEDSPSAELDLSLKL